MRSVDAAPQVRGSAGPDLWIRVTEACSDEVHVIAEAHTEPIERSLPRLWIHPL